LHAKIDNTSAIYVQDDAPAADKRYRARFYFDPNGIEMAGGNTHTLLGGYGGRRRGLTLAPAAPNTLTASRRAAPPVRQPGEHLPGLTREGEILPNKWMQFYTKVLSRFAIGGGLKLSVKVEIRPPEGVSKQRKAETEMALRDLGLEDQVSSAE
jgi:hypothetical protein